MSTKFHATRFAHRRVGVHVWKSWASKNKRLRSLMNAGVEYHEERVCLEFFSRAKEYTRRRKEEKARQVLAADFVEWRMKVRVLRRIREEKGRRQCNRRMGKRAKEHYCKILVGKCILVWSHAVGVSRNAFAGARKMSEAVDQREVVLVFTAWARFSKGAGKLTRASRVVKETRRRGRLAGGVKRWRGLVERRTLQRSFASVVDEVEKKVSIRMGFAAFFTNWKRLRTNDEVLVAHLLQKRRLMLGGIVVCWKKHGLEMKALGVLQYRKMRKIVQDRCFRTLVGWTFKSKHKKFKMKIAEEFWKQRKGFSAIRNFEKHTRVRLGAKLLLSEAVGYHESEMMRAGVAGLGKWRLEGKGRREREKKVKWMVEERRGRLKGGVFWAWHDWAEASAVEKSMNLVANGFMMSALLKQVVRRWSGLVRKRIRAVEVGRVLEDRRGKGVRWSVFVEVSASVLASKTP